MKAGVTLHRVRQVPPIQRIGGLIFGNLTADHYEDKVAADPRIDALRAKMSVLEESDEWRVGVGLIPPWRGPRLRPGHVSRAEVRRQAS